MAERPWFVFAGGGTGGHLFPAVSVVEELREREIQADCTFFCTQRPIDGDILGRINVEARPLSVQPFPSRPWRWPRFLMTWYQSVSACRAAFRARTPAVVIGAGGYASGPPLAAALKLGIPTFLLNPDAVPGRANQHLSRRAGVTAILAQWEVTRRHFPAAAPVDVVGCPVRRAFRLADRTDRAKARASFGLDPGRFTLLVTGASQGARTINEAMMQLAAMLARPDWQVLHLSGEADRERVNAAYGSAGVRASVIAFTDRMAEAMVASDLILTRAGASSLAEILAVGRASILFPYPFHRDQHQRHNGQVLVEAGAARMLTDLKDAAGNARQLEPVLADLLGDQGRREAMSEAASRLGMPQSGALVASRLCRAAGLQADFPG